MTQNLDTHVDLITLDGDGTVWDFEAGMLLGLERVVATMTAWELKIDGHNPTVDRLVADREHVAKDHENMGLSMERLRWLGFERTLQHTQASHRRDLLDTLYDQFMEVRYEAIRPFDDGPPILRALARGRKLALITNGNSHPDRVGLSGIFDLVITAQDRGVWKPDPRIYRLAATELGVDPAKALHVGDHQRDDIQAAKRAGFRTVWINRRGVAMENWCQPDAEISSLAGLPAVIRRLETHCA
jgi:2-haloalkanoic acid dehalogenase type II